MKSKSQLKREEIQKKVNQRIEGAVKTPVFHVELDQHLKEFTKPNPRPFLWVRQEYIDNPDWDAHGNVFRARPAQGNFVKYIESRPKK